MLSNVCCDLRWFLRYICFELFVSKLLAYSQTVVISDGSWMV